MPMDITDIYQLTIETGASSQELIGILQTLQEGLVTFSRTEHEDDGIHAFPICDASGPISAPNNEGQLQIGVGGTTIWVSEGIDWNKYTLASATKDQEYSHPDHPTVGTIEEGLDYILGTLKASEASVLSDQSKYVLDADTNYLGASGASGTELAAFKALDTAIYAGRDAANIVCDDWGGYTALQDVIDNKIEAVIDPSTGTLASTDAAKGASLIGVNDDVTFTHLNNPGNVQEALRVLDNTIDLSLTANNQNFTPSSSYFTGTGWKTAGAIDALGDILYDQIRYTQTYIDQYSVVSYSIGDVVAYVPNPWPTYPGFQSMSVCYVVMRLGTAPSGGPFTVEWRPNGGASVGSVSVLTGTTSIVSTTEWTGFGAGSGDYTELHVTAHNGGGKLTITFIWMAHFQNTVSPS